MASVTQGRPKVGRHPAMWESVPIGSFIQPSTSQHVTLQGRDEHPSDPNVSKKDRGGSKYFSSKKKDDTCHSNKNKPSGMEEQKDKLSWNNQTYRARANLNPNSVPRHRGEFSRPLNHTTFHPSPQSPTFVSNEDDFPSLSGSSDTKPSQAIITTQGTMQLTNISYSEKLKLTHHTPQQEKIESGRTSAGNEEFGITGSQNSSNHSLSKHEKKFFVGNRKNKPSTSINRQNISNTQGHAAHRTSRKLTFGVSGDGNHSDQISPLSKTETEDQRGNNYHTHVNAKGSFEVAGGDGRNFYLTKAEGYSLHNHYNESSRDTVSGDKAGISSNRSARYVKTEIRNDVSQPVKSAGKNKRPVLSEMKERSFSSEVPNGCENMSNDGVVRKMRPDVKNNVLWSSKTAAEHRVIGEKNGKYTVNSELNQENANNSHQETSVKTSKKRKKRKSKLKRNLAFQTGKIMILTPELYSRFTGNLTTSNRRTMPDFSFDLSDMEEYPELGQASNLKPDQHKKVVKHEATDSFENDECDQATSSVISKEIVSKETRCTSQATSPLHETTVGTTAIYEHSMPNVTDKARERKDSDKCDKPCYVPRRKVAIPDSAKISANEEKHSSQVSEQKTKNRLDGSLQISFSDILSSTMVKVKSETSKCKKQSDSRIRVISSKKVKMDKNLHIPPNALDSSRPGVKRGKERERPKPKKHTALKRIILKERNEKKQRRSMNIKEENAKNEVAPENEHQDVFPADKEVKKEPEISADDPEDSLFADFSLEEFTFESHMETKDQCPDHNLNTSDEVQDETLCEKTLEEPLCEKTSEKKVHEEYLCEKTPEEEMQDQLLCIKAQEEKLQDKSMDEKTPREICESLPDEKKMQAIQIAIHTRHFREYCNHLLSSEIDKAALALLGDLTRFQDRLHQKDPAKARIKRRLVYGIKEVTKHLKLKKVKCVILAPDSENIKSKGGLNDAVAEIVRVSAEYHIPCVFALRRKTLGMSCMKPVPVACVGVFNYDGSEVNFKKLIELQSESKKAYDAVLTSLKELITRENVEQLLETQEDSPQSLQSLRITILRETLLEKNPDLHLIFTPQGSVRLGCKEE